VGCHVLGSGAPSFHIPSLPCSGTSRAAIFCNIERYRRAVMQSSWEHLADEILFKPLDMADTSYRHADYQEAPNRALIHVPAGNRTWVAKYNRDADPEAPAGGASLSVRDLARWLRLQLANGSYDGPALNPSGRTATDWPGQSSHPAPELPYQSLRHGNQRPARLLRRDRAGHLHPGLSAGVLP
jgi:CubicO group peptidase (beta-lactamase class C family)